MTLVVGPWLWIVDRSASNGGHWSPPAGSVAALDLRSTPECAAAGGVPGTGCFVVADSFLLGVDYLELTDPLTLAARSLLGVSSSDRSNALWERFTVAADPTGDTKNKPLGVESDRRSRLRLGRFVRERQIRPADPEWPNLREVLRRSVPPDDGTTLRGRVLWTTLRKLTGRRPTREDCRDLLGFDESLVEPQTTITDSFDRADNTDISLNAPFAWTEVFGDLQIQGNLLKGVSAQAAKRARAESDLSSSDHYSQVIANSIGADASRTCAAYARYAAAADTCYGVELHGTATGLLRIFKVEAGTQTDLGAGVDPAESLPDTIKLECNGSTLKSFFNGVEQESITDTSITGNTRCGAGGNGTTNFSANDFDGADLAVGQPAAKRYSQAPYCGMPRPRGARIG